MASSKNPDTPIDFLRDWRASLRWLCFTVVVALAGCVTPGYPPAGPGAGPGQPPFGPAPQYDVVANRTPQIVARLRAAPPPDQPSVGDGGNRIGDERVLRERGLVKIGIGHFRATDPDQAHSLAEQQAVAHGAEEVRIYPPQPGGDKASAGLWIADFYVRLQLPFGADFRDLTAAERKQLGSGGVEIGQVIGQTPASAANLRSGDFVLKLNRHAIKDRADFQGQLSGHMGRNVTLTIRRGNVTLKRLVQLGTLPDGAKN